MKVKFKLQNHGCKNHPYWWIIVQSARKNPRGRMLEKVGLWIPQQRKTVDRSIVLNTHRIKYWFSVGAEPTDGVRKVFEKAELLPKKPIPYGTKYVYSKPPKKYELTDFKFKMGSKRNPHLFGLQRIQELQNVINRRKMLEQEAARDVNFAKLDPRNCETTDIDSEGIDLEQRVLNFSEITKRLKDHLSTTEFKGNDYNSNVYIRKLQKMAKNDFGLDIEGYENFKEVLVESTGIADPFELANQPARNALGMIEEDFHPHKFVEHVSEKTIDVATDDMPTLDDFVRYPKGWRQYENYETYQRRFHDKTIQDYHNDMNRECTFEEFFQIGLSALRFHAKYHNKENEGFPKLEPVPQLYIYFEERPPLDIKKVEAMANDPNARAQCEAYYDGILKTYYAHQRIFSLVEALENTVSYWGEAPLENLPTYNMYIPVRNPLTPRPDFRDPLSPLKIPRYANVTNLESGLKRTLYINIYIYI